MQLRHAGIVLNVSDDLELDANGHVRPGARPRPGQERKDTQQNTHNVHPNSNNTAGDKYQCAIENGIGHFSHYFVFSPYRSCSAGLPSYGEEIRRHGPGVASNEFGFVG